MNRERKIMLNVAILLIALCMAGVVRAAPMGTAFTYQGRLYDANSPADGLYDFQFELWDDPEAGSWQGSPVNKDDMDVIDGYVTVELDFGSDIFTGDARWLQLNVRPGDSTDPNDFMTLSPRQELTPVPYALHAASGTGIPVPLELSGSITSPIITATNTGDGHGIYGATISANNGAGVYGSAGGEDGYGVVGNAYNDGDTINIGGLFTAEGKYGMGVRSLAPHTEGGNYGGYFSASGETGRGVYGLADATAKATNYGGYFESSGEYGRGVYGLGEGDAGYGVYGEAAGAYGYGVYGKATSPTDAPNYGGYFETASDIGYGVYGAATNSVDSTNYGGYFTASGETARAVYGEADNSGANTNYGGYFTAAGSYARGVYGEATNTGHVTNYGGYFVASGENGQAVYGAATAIGNVTNYGGNFAAAGDDGVGIQAMVLGSDAVGVKAFSGGANATSVQGLAEGTNGTGIFGHALGSNGVGVYGKGTEGSKAGLFEGDVNIDGDVDVDGNIHAVEEITKAYTAETSNRAVPIAYAFIDSDGSVHSGTPNVSCSWSTTDNRYEITIAGESYFYNNYATVVTTSGTTAYFARCKSSSGKLIVELYNLTGTRIQGQFQFVTYKP